MRFSVQSRETRIAKVVERHRADQVKRWHKLIDVHAWFAWRPVQVADHVVWLETVARTHSAECVDKMVWRWSAPGFIRLSYYRITATHCSLWEDYVAWKLTSGEGN